MSQGSETSSARSMDGVAPTTPSQNGAHTSTPPHRTPQKQNTRHLARRAQIQGQGRRGHYPQSAGGVEESGGRSSPRTERIDGLSKAAMLAVAFIFDLLPILAITGLAVYLMMTLGGDGAVGQCQSLKNTSTYDLWFKVDATTKIGACAKVGFAAFLASGTIFVFGPLVLGLTSLLVLIMAPLTFFLWFKMKGVPYLSHKGGRMNTLLTSGLIKCIPLFGLIPAITYATWKLIRISRKEDAEGVTE